MGHDGWPRALRVAPDTNILVRVLTSDDAEQAQLARKSLSMAQTIYLSLPVLCETAWVLGRFFGASREEIATAIRSLTDSANTVFDARAVSTGLKLLDAGGDFADGVIAAAGIGMGAEVFLTFDRSASKRLTDLGIVVQTPID